MKMLPNALLNLLEAQASNPIVARCDDEIRFGQVKYEGEAVLPVARALDVYSTRAKNNSDLNGGEIKGFEELLIELRALSNSGSVRLHSIECLSRWFILFTDESESHLFGILESPKRKPIWFDLVTGYES